MTKYRTLFIQDITQGLLVDVLLNPFKEAGKCCDLSLPGTVAGQTVTMRATVTMQLLTLTKFVKLIQKSFYSILNSLTFSSLHVDKLGLYLNLVKNLGYRKRIEIYQQDSLSLLVSDKQVS